MLQMHVVRFFCLVKNLSQNQRCSGEKEKKERKKQTKLQNYTNRNISVAKFQSKMNAE